MPKVNIFEVLREVLLAAQFVIPHATLCTNLFAYGVRHVSRADFLCNVTVLSLNAAFLTSKPTKTTTSTSLFSRVFAKFFTNYADCIQTWKKTSCCYACMLFSFGKTVPVWNRRHICLKLDCSMFTTLQVSGESNKLLWWSSSRSRLLFRARTNKGKKNPQKNRIKKCSSVSQLNKRGGEDRKGTVGGPKSYCQYKTLSRLHEFKIKKENGMKKIVQKKHFRFCY